MTRRRCTHIWSPAASGATITRWKDPRPRRGYVQTPGYRAFVSRPHQGAGPSLRKGVLQPGRGGPLTVAYLTYHEATCRTGSYDSMVARAKELGRDDCLQTLGKL